MIKLTVKSGLLKPYLYKSKAYKRNDTATIEVNTLEFLRLVLDGKKSDLKNCLAKIRNCSLKFYTVGFSEQACVLGLPVPVISSNECSAFFRN